MKFLFALFAATMASAAPIVVSFDTSALVGTHFIDLQLNSGDDLTGNGNNTATLTDFQFGGGSAAINSLDGGASGTVAGGFTITDTSPFGFNGVLLSLTPGTLFQFTLNVTQNFTTGLPDQFSFAILDNTLASIVSAGNGALVTIDLGVGIGPQLLASDAGVTATISSVPEPRTLTLVAPLLALGVLRLRRYSKRG
jgi:hypothetical protein